MKKYTDIYWFGLTVAVMILAVLLARFAWAVENMAADEYFGEMFPKAQREAFENSSGSCVMFSTSAAGIWQNQPIAWTLTWDTEYGCAVRGGSTPSRFERDAKARGLDALSVTGSMTYDYMRWGIRNGRWVAIGAGTAHFQTLVDYDDRGTPQTSDDYWYVWNCNRYHTVTRYTDAEFRRLHEASGRWCIVMKAYPDRPGNLEWTAQ